MHLLCSTWSDVIATPPTTAIACAILVNRVIEGTIHCVSNLIESFHQSFYYYLLPYSFQYVSIGQYMISLGLIVAPIPLCVCVIAAQQRHNA
jgi:hypothetical protein